MVTTACTNLDSHVERADVTVEFDVGQNEVIAWQAQSVHVRDACLHALFQGDVRRLDSVEPRRGRRAAEKHALFQGDVRRSDGVELPDEAVGPPKNLASRLTVGAWSSDQTAAVVRAISHSVQSNGVTMRSGHRPRAGTRSAKLFSKRSTRLNVSNALQVRGSTPLGAAQFHAAWLGGNSRWYRRRRRYL